MLYASDLEAEQMRQEKAGMIFSLRDDYEAAKQAWDGFDAYDNWFATEINNAKLRTVSTYFNRVAAFDALLAEVNFDLPRFYQRVEELSRLPDVERTSMLAELTY